jgi:membrane protein YdbS with pleckstrin-like domain
MYNWFCEWAERILRIPPAPEHPPGDEHTTQVFHAAPNFYRYLLAIWGLTSAGLLVPAAIVAGMPTVGGFALMKRGNNLGIFLFVISFLIFAAFVLSRLFALVVVRLDFEKRWYVVTDRSLRIREGIINIREMTVNFANIQNISISQGPIQRLLAIADLRVDTAGGGGDGQEHSHYHQSENLHTAFFRGVNNAAQVRELIQDRIRHLKDAGLGDHDDAAPPARDTEASGVIAILREIEAEAVGFRTILAGK